MKLLRRILVTIVATLVVIYVGINWVAPVALSYYAARRAPQIAAVVPIDLKDRSVSQVPGQKLSYFGYQFEVPWNDLDEPQTKLFPQDSPNKNRVDLQFRSGLRMVVTAIPPGEWTHDLSTELHLSPQAIESTFGSEATKSDFSFVETLYEFTPDKMNHWTFSRGGINRDELLLMIKSIALLKPAETGIFRIRNQSLKGFQQGNPQVRQDSIAVNLYSDQGSLEIMFFQKGYRKTAGVTQPEINRIVESLQKATQVRQSPRESKTRG